jgi:CBS domain-containing protein
MIQKVRDIMTKVPVQVRPQTAVADVAKLMLRQDVGDVLVMDDNGLRGLVTDRDLVIRVLADDRGPETPVGSVCSENLVTLSPQDDVDRAVALMRAHTVRRLPVVENGIAVGVVSLGDLAKDRDPDSVLGRISAAGPDV